MNIRTNQIGILFGIACSFFLTSGLSACPQIHEFDLTNGIHIIVNPIPESEDVGVETFHEVGFIDEPESARHTIKWDSEHQAVCVAWNPPPEKSDQVLLSLLGTTVMQSLANDASLKEKTELVMCSNNMWMVGDLPLFVYAMAKPDQNLDEIETMISAVDKDAAVCQKSSRDGAIGSDRSANGITSRRTGPLFGSSFAGVQPPAND